jgi:RNA polymerase sigma-70 factor (ECF subfamily)
VTLSDSAIVRRVLDGDVEAFGLLVDRYHEHYYRLARHLVGNREDAEEVVQDTWVRAYRALGRYEERERFGAWLMRILVNQARTVAKRSRRRERLFPDVPSPEGDWADRTDHAEPHPAERSALREEVYQALGQLGADQREAFLLHHVEGLAYEEMSAITGTRISALKMRVKRACDRLRLLLEVPRV